MAAHDELPTAEHNQKMIAEAAKRLEIELTRSLEDDRINVVVFRIPKHGRRYGKPIVELKQVEFEKEYTGRGNRGGSLVR